MVGTLYTQTLYTYFCNGSFPTHLCLVFLSYLNANQNSWIEVSLILVLSSLNSQCYILFTFVYFLECILYLHVRPITRWSSKELSGHKHYTCVTIVHTQYNYIFSLLQDERFPFLSHTLTARNFEIRVGEEFTYSSNTIRSGLNLFTLDKIWALVVFHRENGRLVYYRGTSETFFGYGNYYNANLHA